MSSVHFWSFKGKQLWLSNIHMKKQSLVCCGPFHFKYQINSYNKYFTKFVHKQSKSLLVLSIDNMANFESAYLTLYQFNPSIWYWIGIQEHIRIYYLICSLV